MLRRRSSLALVCLIAGAALSALLLFQHHGVGDARQAVDAVCGQSGDQPSGCEEVARSPFSAIRGVPIAAFGLAFSLSLCGLLALVVVAGPELAAALSALALLALGLALVIDLMLFGVQVFAIGRFCLLCLATYAANAVAFAALWPARSAFGSARAALASPEGRMAVSGVAISVALALTGTAITEKALLAAAAAADARLLGSASQALSSSAEPALPTAPAAVAPTSAAPTSTEGATTGASAALAPLTTLASTPAAGSTGELAQARAETQRLQAILDDPGKLQAYLTQKATDAFNQAKVENLDLKSAPGKGPDNAPVKVVEFSDFLCPFCQRLAAGFGSYLPTSGNRVAILFKHYPLDTECNPTLARTVHPGACQLALGAVCAQEQGKFWAYHDRVFGAPPQNPTREDVVRIATGAGLDPTALGACLDSSKARDRLSADISEAQRLAVQSTPSLFVNGKRLPDLNLFVQAVESESRRLGLPPLAPPSPR